MAAIVASAEVDFCFVIYSDRLLCSKRKSHIECLSARPWTKKSAGVASAFCQTGIFFNAMISILNCLLDSPHCEQQGPTARHPM
jgi:hypothetical protein